MHVFRNSPLLSKSPARPAFDHVAVTARQTAQTIAILLVISASFTGGAAAARSSGMERVSSEPFGLPTVEVPSGPLVTKWRNVERDIRQDELLLARCAVDRSCGSAAALRLMDIADAAGRREGRTRVGQINRAINFAIRPTSDLAQYGVPDLWTAPIQTLTTGAGDCEDYAIAKYVALEEAGVAEEDLRLLVVRDTRRREDHAMVAVRLDGRWLLLDNRWLALVEDRELENYLPMFEMNRDGVRRFLAAAQPRVLPRGATEAASASLRSQAQPPEHPS